MWYIVGFFPPKESADRVQGVSGTSPTLDPPTKHTEADILFLMAGWQ